MNTSLKQVIRAANLIRDQLVLVSQRESKGRVDRLSHLLGQFDRLHALGRSLRHCSACGYRGAAAMLEDRVSDSLAELAHDLADVERALAPEKRSSAPLPSLRQIVEELQQIETEFGAWQFGAPGAENPRCNRHSSSPVLSVRTEPIELEGVALGRFDLCLCLNAIAEQARSAPYGVVAVDPNPPANNDSVTHPHVNDERLCEGSAAAAIRTALRQGRLCDFFLLIRSVLQTYNPDSPYVKLEHWEGQACHDCGGMVDEDSRYYCESCDHDFCGDCTGSCSCCDQTTCLACLEECRACEERCCSGCIKACTGCGRACCGDCLEDNFCPDCRESQPEENPDEVQALASITPGPAPASTQDGNDATPLTPGCAESQAIAGVPGGASE